MELFALEHKKLWRGTGTRICVLLCFAYFVLYGGVLGYQWFLYGSEGDDPTRAYNHRFDGYCAIRDYKELAASYGGVWTDETLPRMVKDYNDMGHPGFQNMADWTLALLYVDRLYPELEDPEQRFISMMYYVDPEELTDFYGRRQEYLEQALETRRQNGELTEDDVAMLLEMDSRVEKPWRYEWVTGWDHEVRSLAGMGAQLAPWLAVALAFTFSGERQSGASALLRAAKHGRRRLARAKVLSALAFSAEIYALIVGGSVALQFVYLGTDGWDLPIQYDDLLTVAPWNMLQAELYALAFSFLNVIGYVGLVMLLSALVKSNVLSVILSLAVVYGPGLLEDYLPRWARHALQLLPPASGGSDIFACHVFHIFGKSIWSPYVLITVPVLIGLACLPLAVWSWSRRR